jgi:sigma54-dependent transcription regulator
VKADVRRRAPDARNATHSGVSTRATHGCFSRMMHKSNRASLTSRAALLLL